MKKKLLPLISFIAIYVFGNTLFNLSKSGFTSTIFIVFIFYLLSGITSYLLALFVLPKLFKSSSIFKGIALLVIFFSLYVSTDYINEIYLASWLNTNTTEAIGIWEFIPLIIPHFIVASGFSLGFYYFFRFYETDFKRLEAEKGQLESENRIKQLENESLQTQLKMLRFQLNPHFLRNVLTAIQLINSKDEHKADDMMLKLADLMDYSLKEPNADIKECLDDEIIAVELLLELISEWYPGRWAVKFIVEGETDDKRIVGHLLVTLVENLITYGYVDDLSKPAVIHLRIIDDKLLFQTFNYINKDKEAIKSTKVGTKNIKRLLELTYADTFSYEINRTDTTYTIHLSLIL
jgi:sensor histidine kinase YesM